MYHLEDFNYLNGYWQTQPLSTHHRRLHVVADSLQVADVSTRCVTEFWFFGELCEFLSKQ